MIEVAFVVSFFALTFVVARLKDDLSVIDLVWGPSFLVSLLVSAIFVNSNLNIEVLILILFISLWALRLFSYLTYRWIKKGKEDYRYTNFRKEWKTNIYRKAFFRVYMLQAFLSLFIAIPCILLPYYSKSVSLNSINYFGIIVMFIGILIESIADFQKDSFKKRNSTKRFCQVGLWNYSRHPNYFGEALFWWGVFVYVSSSVPVYLSVLSVLSITFLLVKVSGKAMLEKEYEKHPEFADYKNSTSGFIPWFKRS